MYTPSFNDFHKRRRRRQFTCFSFPYNKSESGSPLQNVIWLVHYISDFPKSYDGFVYATDINIGHESYGPFTFWTLTASFTFIMRKKVVSTFWYPSSFVSQKKENHTVQGQFDAEYMGTLFLCELFLETSQWTTKRKDERHFPKCSQA